VLSTQPKDSSEPKAAAKAAGGGAKSVSLFTLFSDWFRPDLSAELYGKMCI